MAFWNTGKLSAKVRHLNFIFFILTSCVMSAVLLFSFRNIANTVSMDYARLYSSKLLETLNVYFSGEIALIRKTARSNAIINWFADEENPEKKNHACDELIGVINALRSGFLYVVIDKSLNEYSIEQEVTLDDIQPHATANPDNAIDEWYFRCTNSDKEYLLKVDIDKAKHRKLVWLNYTVMRNGRVYGAFSTGLEFSSMIEKLFAHFTDQCVRVLVIDENGIIQIDSVARDSFLYSQFDVERHIKDEFHDKGFVSAISEYIESIDGYFTDDSPTVTIERSTGQFNYATISPINATTWSIITLFNASSLFSIMTLAPPLIIMLVLFVAYLVATNIICNRYIFKPYESLYEKTNEQNQIILDGISYAGKIQRNLLPQEKALAESFLDHSVIWEPRDIVGGDIYWIKRFDKGTTMCVCDCTGHGTPGALLSVLVVSALEAMVWQSNCYNTAKILWGIDTRLSYVFNVRPEETHTTHSDESWLTLASDIKNGCDIAILFIDNDGNVMVSCARTNVFVCNGRKVKRIKGQKFFVGEGNIESSEDIKSILIPADPDNKFYVASDGLFDQPGGKDSMPFGYKLFEKIILKNHSEKLGVISGAIWEAFEKHRCHEPRVDDFELISFTPRI